MNSWQRARAVIERKIPDSVPRALYDVAIETYNQSTIDLFLRKCGKHPRDCFRQDLRAVHCPQRIMPEDWRRRVRNMRTGEEVRAVMAPWLEQKPGVEELRREVDRLHRAGYPAVAVGYVSDVETAFSLRGMEQFYMDIASGESWLPMFLDCVTDAACEDARAAAAAGADIFGIGDDLGSQRALLISPRHWRELFKPRLKRIVEAAHAADSRTKFFLHSDGYVRDIIPDLVEIGVDILNPIQPEVMDPAQIKSEFGKDLVFFGAVSVQHTLPLGTPQDVFNEVKLRMETIGAGGGYLMTPSHMINADIPWENIVAFFDAADRYGNYTEADA